MKLRQIPLIIGPDLADDGYSTSEKEQPWTG
jgi:hypothetical protein